MRFLGRSLRVLCLKSEIRFHDHAMNRSFLCSEPTLSTKLNDRKCGYKAILCFIQTNNCIGIVGFLTLLDHTIVQLGNYPITVSNSPIMAKHFRKL